MPDVIASLTESAGQLRAAVAAGTVPPKVANELEEILARLHEGPAAFESVLPDSDTREPE